MVCRCEMKYEAEAMTEDRESRALPGGRDLLAAVGLLTVLPVERPEPKSDAFGRAVLFFPCVGLMMGVVLVGLNWLSAGWMSAWWTAVLLVGAWEALSRGEMLWAVVSRRRGGGLAAAVVVLAKIVGLAVARLRPAALLFAPMLARWCMVVLATGARDAHTPSQKFNSGVSFREFALTSVFTCAVVFSLTEAVGILVVVCVAALTLGLRLLLHRWPGGVSWPLLQASAELIETLTVVLFAAL